MHLFLFVENKLESIGGSSVEWQDMQPQVFAEVKVGSSPDCMGHVGDGRARYHWEIQTGNSMN